MPIGNRQMMCREWTPLGQPGALEPSKNSKFARPISYLRRNDSTPDHWCCRKLAHEGNHRNRLGDEWTSGMIFTRRGYPDPLVIVGWDYLRNRSVS